MRETTEQWDDLPPGAKVVGKRRDPRASPGAGYGLQDLANEMGSFDSPQGRQSRVTWPKGIIRFKTHEEADAWWIEKIQTREQPDRTSSRWTGDV